MLSKRILYVALAYFFTLSAVSAQQDTRATLFGEADRTMQVAKDMQADILTPKAYGKAMENYSKAEADFKRGKSLDDIRKQLRAATANFQRAIEGTKLANVSLSSAITARAGALSAEAPKFSADIWQEAGKKFSEAAGRLEDGDVNDAKKKSAEAQKLFRDAELAAIKANYLSQTWNLLKNAEKMNVKKYAPQTLKVSQDLIARAEKELTDNRYDTDVARDLARQAHYEVRHAIFLANQIQAMQKSKKSWEDLMLAAEKPLQKVAATFDVNATFDTGYDAPTEIIVSKIVALQDDNRQQHQNLDAGSQQIAMQGERIAELETQLGGVEKEKSELSKRMEAEAKLRERFLSVEQLFTKPEAMVLRQGSDIILRLVGLNFSSGKSVIEPQYYAMLTKVQKAITTFPNANLTVEGHTDSYGSDENNVKLSNERAEAVRQYLLANMGLAPSRVSAVGYGESRPIASNETAEGRTKNRRIDIVLHTDAGGTF
jgi:outer membrane protein OmpA-like peptidoglycan-associated protein